jgi:hypothetical protein
MIEIKRCNYITGHDVSSVSFGLTKIVDFLEASGRTPLFLSKPDNKTSLKSFIKSSKFEFKNRHEFEVIITNKGNLFRVDLLIVDLWHLSTVSSVLDYKKILDKLNIDYMIVCTKYHYKVDDNNTRVYHIDKEVIDTVSWIKNYNYIISEKVDGWKSTIDDLILSYKRDKKIDDIFGENSI